MSRITGFFHGILHGDKIVLKANDSRDMYNIQKLFESKVSRENRSKKEILLKCDIDAEFQHVSYKQRNSVFKLVTVIFQSDSENHRKPTQEEKYELYLDLLDLYADKIPNRYTGQLRSIHISESNTLAGSHFIDGLLFHVTQLCTLPVDLQATVRDVLYEWEIWRGSQEHDINDDRTINDLKEYVKYSEASGRIPVEYHHIMSRGAFPNCIQKAWNIVALTHDEHMEFHEKGWDYFLEKYPHLKGKFERAKIKANKDTETDNMTSLALAALGE